MFIAVPSSMKEGALIETQKKCDQFIWISDINADFKISTRFVEIIENFICELDILKPRVNHGINTKLILLAYLKLTVIHIFQQLTISFGTLRSMIR